MAIYISEFKYSPGGNSKFVEVVATDGEDVSGFSIAVYGDDGRLRTTLNFGSVDDTWGDRAGYVANLNDGFPDAFGSDWSIAIIDDAGGVVQFIGPGDPPTAVDGPAAGQSPTGVATAWGNRSLGTGDGGQTYASGSASEGTIPCYVPGTMIDTPAGPRRVDDLRPGDLVTTRDHGPQPVLWTRGSDHPLEGVERDQRPVLIRSGALGSGLPAADLVVSPQHRILVGGDGQLGGIFGEQVFVPAKALTGLPRIRHMMGKSGITWLHFACARHEVVRANGCWSESLLLGPMVVNGLGAGERAALRALYPDAADPEMLNGPPARRCLTVGEARRAITGRIEAA